MHFTIHARVKKPKIMHINMDMHTKNQNQNNSAINWVSYVFAGLALLCIVKFGLIVALFSGLLIHALANKLAPFINPKTRSNQARTLAVLVLLTVVVSTLCVGIWAVVLFFQSEAGSMPALLQKVADILEQSRNQLPLWLADYLPQGTEGVQEFASDWVAEHVADAKSIGQEVGHVAVQLVLGIIIGSMLALQDTHNCKPARPLAAAVFQRVANFALMFEKVVFAQVQISLINATFTGIYLTLILPLFGVSLPLTKTMIAVTFFTGLVPVVGNIISNSVIVLVCLSHSVHVATISLLFMVVIHKLEYFLNARIIGAQIKAKAWEMLCAILLMETLFGLAGVVAAPVFYAYIKKELMDKHLV